jgi:hypothetical protein
MRVENSGRTTRPPHTKKAARPEKEFGPGRGPFLPRPVPEPFNGWRFLGWLAAERSDAPERPAFGTGASLRSAASHPQVFGPSATFQGPWPGAGAC